MYWLVTVLVIPVEILTRSVLNTLWGVDHIPHGAIVFSGVTARDMVPVRRNVLHWLRSGDVAVMGCWGTDSVGSFQGTLPLCRRTATASERQDQEQRCYEFHKIAWL